MRKSFEENDFDPKQNEIKSIHIVADNLTYCPEPDSDEEIMQYLKIESTGRVSFCARNYRQWRDKKGFCRMKRINIGQRKAKELLALSDQLTDYYCITDCGYYNVKIKYSDKRIREVSGSLPDYKMVIRNGEEISYSKLLREYIPVDDLWGITSDS